jgi:hypothetical protein
MQINSKTDFTWDSDYVSKVIELTASNRHAFLSEDNYLFRSCIGTVGFESGTHYWEIVSDSRTENEFKVGVIKNKNIDLKTAFSDYSCGWAYYATGQLRHCDAAVGPKYGKGFKKQGTLGVYLDMDKGTLSFALDDKYMGIAFEDEELKKGPIYPAIALIH